MRAVVPAPWVACATGMSTTILPTGSVRLRINSKACCRSSKRKRCVISARAWSRCRASSSSPAGMRFRLFRLPSRSISLKGMVLIGTDAVRAEIPTCTIRPALATRRMAFSNEDGIPVASMTSSGQTSP